MSGATPAPATEPAEPLPGLDEQVTAIVERRRGDRGPLMIVLHDLQEALGYVPREAVPMIARELNLSRADVYGVITFYRDFRSAPPAPVTVQVCRAEACQSVGAHALTEHAKQALGAELGGTTADGEVSLDQVFCLGNCALGPSATVNGQLYGRVDGARLDELVAEARAAKVGAA
jgi:formate dehydrogenase subunit gamma